MELTNQHLTRQLDLIPLAVLTTPVTIVGAGAIGSFLTLQLAKMGFTDLTVWDFDSVDIVNMNSQFYRFSDIGKQKVHALYELVKDFTGVHIVAANAAYQCSNHTKGIVVSAVDSMNVRKEIFEAVRDTAFDVKYIIDPRMGAEVAALFVVDPFDPTSSSKYAKSLFSDDDATQERCTAKATIYTANLLSGLVAKTIKSLVCEEKVDAKVKWSIKENQLINYRRQ